MGRKRPKQHNRKGYTRNNGTPVRGTVVNQGLIREQEFQKGLDAEMKELVKEMKELKGEKKDMEKTLKEKEKTISKGAKQLDKKIHDDKEDSESELGSIAKKVDSASVKKIELKDQKTGVSKEKKRVEKLKKDAKQELKRSKKRVKSLKKQSKET